MSCAVFLNSVSLEFLSNGLASFHSSTRASSYSFFRWQLFFTLFLTVCHPPSKPSTISLALSAISSSPSMEQAFIVLYLYFLCFFYFFFLSWAHFFLAFFHEALWRCSPQCNFSKTGLLEKWVREYTCWSLHAPIEVRSVFGLSCMHSVRVLIVRYMLVCCPSLIRRIWLVELKPCVTYSLPIPFKRSMSGACTSVFLVFLSDWLFATG